MRLALILSLLFFVGCASTTTETLDSSTFYKRDMIITDVDSGVSYEGVAVLPRREKYNLKLVAHGKLDLMTLTTCHREDALVRQWDITETETRRLFGKKIKKIEHPKEVTLDFELNEFELDRAFCPISITALEQSQGRHSWALIDYFNPNLFSLNATLECNGNTDEVNGVAICQVREGLIEKITFKESVIADANDACLATLNTKTGQEFEIVLAKERCTFIFKNPERKRFKLTTVGYESIILRAN